MERGQVAPLPGGERPALQDAGRTTGARGFTYAWRSIGSSISNVLPHRLLRTSRRSMSGSDLQSLAAAL